VESDRPHPRKRFRPIASGAVPIPVAVALGAALMLAGFATAYLVGLALLGLVVLYVTLSSLYTVWLKHLAVVDLAVIASFFILRAVAGGVATGAYPSRWFLIVASFGSLFVVAGKRHGESLDLGESRGAIRATLDAYTPEFLRYVWTVASGVTLAAYCLWAFEQSPTPAAFPWFELSIIPFVLFVLRYALIIDAGKASAPEDVVLGDRSLQVLGVLWVVVFACGVYLVGG
jgi:decaprenyl-phosphate phosphoribosyltransferase